MAIVNKRNAFVGWAALKLGKRVARRKVRGAKDVLTSPRGRRHIRRLSTR